MGWGGVTGMTANGYGISFGFDKNILKLIVVMVAQLWKYLKLFNCNVKWVNYITMKLLKKKR